MSENETSAPIIDDQRESRIRSILKALSWRIFSTFITFGIVYGITGKTEAAFAIGAIEFFIKFFTYYIHERAWQLAPRGAVRKFFSRSKSNT